MSRYLGMKLWIVLPRLGSHCPFSRVGTCIGLDGDETCKTMDNEFEPLASQRFHSTLKVRIGLEPAARVFNVLMEPAFLPRASWFFEYKFSKVKPSATGARRRVSRASAARRRVSRASAARRKATSAPDFQSPRGSASASELKMAQAQSWARRRCWGAGGRTGVAAADEATGRSFG
jgi:hypothetical protein